MRGLDLSEIHAPVGTLFADNGSRPIDDAHCDFFNENGYVAGIPLLTGEQVAALRSELAVLMKPEYDDDARFYEYNRNESSDPSKMLFHALGSWRVSPSFHDLIFYAPIAAAAEKLLGPVRFWHDQLFVKPPLDGGVVAWHQDYSYWTRTKPVAHLTCWIALDDSTLENGCLNYVPGSHRWPLLPRLELAHDMNSVLALLNDEQKAHFDPVPVELKAGEASFHHPMTLHGSYENRSNMPRRATVVNLMLDGVRSNTDEPLLAGVSPIAKERKIEGRFFPLISR